jgi:dTDP-4-dehydrorhamnose 3,5-epimerase-like enzyme
VIIKGDIFTDQRGIIRFVNDFNFEGIKRFYTITHPDPSVIRAWQGHKLETKYFYISKGSFLINWIEIDDWKHPSKGLKIHSKILSDQESEILIVPPGHANGFKAIEPDSTMIVFSDMILEDSKADDYRWKKDFFSFNWENIIDHLTP